MKPNLIPALILIVIGGLLLANNLIPNFHIASLIHTWWPLLLIIWGASMLFRNSQR